MIYGVTTMFSPNTLRNRLFYSLPQVVIFSELAEAFKTFSDKGHDITASSFFLRKLIKSYQGIVAFSRL
ncbi:MAG: hypothetical protein EBT93_09950 [Alphaproteobacteria bacterium]|nr:hypothetical protein [Alphaproteobacteria bacterium]